MCKMFFGFALCFLCCMQKHLEQIELELADRIYKVFLVKFNGNKSIMHQHLTGRMLLSHTFVHGIVWQYIYIISVHTGCFRHFQLLQVTRQSSLGQSESFFRQFLQQLFLATYFLARNNNLNGIKSAILALHTA